MPGTIAGRTFKNINHATIGVELANAGPLIGHEGQFYAWPYWKAGSNKFPEPSLRIEPHRVVVRDLVAFDGFPEEQVTSARKLVEVLVRALGWDTSALRHGHADFAAPRKTDPGPLWMKGILPDLIAKMQPGSSSREGRA
jgi:N-acetyl-anhydromuramyl-L-alanine amidase AmpD